jgi:hypothetical protein
MAVIDAMRSEDWKAEDVLAADDGGRMLREAVDALRTARAGLKARLDRGVTPADFKKGQALLASYDAAVAGLEKAWLQAHGA